MTSANKILPAAVLTAFAVSAVAGCSSSSSTTATTTGTETLAGTVLGAAAVAGNNGPTVPLTLTGPVATTSSFVPPNNNSTKAVITFKTPVGNLVVAANAPDANQNPVPNATTCYFSQTVHATYVVQGGTGKFAGATGSGKATFAFSATAPKLASGKCDESDNAQPLAKGAVVTFTASGPLTVKP